MNLRTQVLARDGFRCRRCGFAPERGKGLEVSHITPKLRGGPDLPENVALLCTPCHTDWHRAEQAGVEFSGWVAATILPVQDRPPRRGKPDGAGPPLVYSEMSSIRFTDTQEDAIRELAAHWKTSESEAVRRAVLEMAKRARRMKP